MELYRSKFREISLVGKQNFATKIKGFGLITADKANIGGYGVLSLYCKLIYASQQ